MDTPTTIQRTFKTRVATASLAALIGATSAWVMTVTCYRLFFDTSFRRYGETRTSSLSGRYRLFDVVLVVWCVDGVTAAFLLFRSVVLHVRLTVLARRTTVLFFLGFAVLVVGGLLGMWLRRRGILSITVDIRQVTSSRWSTGEKSLLHK